MHKKWFAIVLMVTVLVVLVGVAPASAAPNEGNTIHVVQYGETLYSIARRYGVSVWNITRANNIANPNRIYVGQRLVIPMGGSGHSNRVVHVVRRGETLTHIAWRYRVNVWVIARANGITNLNHIYVGQCLVIPQYVPPPPPPPPCGTTTTPRCPTPPPPCGTPTTPHCPHPSYSTDWFGQFYNNKDMAGDPVFTLQTSRIEFDWGTESPTRDVWWDNFSARFTSKIYLKASHYRFCAKSDDGVRIWVGNDLVLDGWHANNGAEAVCANHWVATGTYNAKVEYYENGGDALLHVWWEPY